MKFLIPINCIALGVLSACGSFTMPSTGSTPSPVSSSNPSSDSSRQDIDPTAKLNPIQKNLSSLLVEPPIPFFQYRGPGGEIKKGPYSKVRSGPSFEVKIPPVMSDIRNVPSIVKTGPSDLEQASKENDLHGAKVELTKDKFVAGYRTNWVDKSTNSMILLTIYQFQNSHRASKYRQGTESDLIGEPIEPTSNSHVEGIPDTFLLSNTAVLSDRNSQGSEFTIFSKGNYSVEIDAGGRKITPEFINDLAVQQYKKLPPNS